MPVVINGSTGVTQTSSFDSAGTFGFKNRLINGGMVFDQRNAGAEVNPAVDGAYYLDRWNVTSGAASKFKIGRNAGSVTPPAGFSNYLGCTSLSAYSVGATESFLVNQMIEGFNFADMDWGTANAKSVTLSFYVYSSLTGTFGGSLRNSAVNRSYPFSYTISSANTWELKTVTIAGDTSGTWIGATNGIGVIVGFSLGSGSSRVATAGAWAASNYTGATGQVSVVGTNGATFYLTGVQLEKGSTATSFDFRDYGTELLRCQRYFAKSFPVETAPANNLGINSGENSLMGILAGANQNYGHFFSWPVFMRVTPSVVTIYTPGASTAGQAQNLVTTQPCSTTQFQAVTSRGSRVQFVQDAGAGAGQLYGFHWTASAEL